MRIVEELEPARRIRSRRAGARVDDDRGLLADPAEAEASCHRVGSRLEASRREAAGTMLTEPTPDVPRLDSSSRVLEPSP